MFTLDDNEWQTDEYGKRYRMIGNCREHEMEINGIPQSKFYAMQKRSKELEAIRREEEKQKALETAAQSRICPFKDGMHPNCIREDCAFYMDGCTLARFTSAKDTEGLQCPIRKGNRKCCTDCALYNGGCAITGISISK